MGQRRKVGDVRISHLPKGVQHAGATRVERMQERSSVTDLVFISKNAWTSARWHAGGMKTLDEQKGPLAPRIKRMATSRGRCRNPRNVACQLSIAHLPEGRRYRQNAISKSLNQRRESQSIPAIKGKTYRMSVHGK